MVLSIYYFAIYNLQFNVNRGLKKDESLQLCKRTNSKKTKAICQPNMIISTITIIIRM